MTFPPILQRIKDMAQFTVTLNIDADMDEEDIYDLISELMDDCDFVLESIDVEENDE